MSHAAILKLQRAGFSEAQVEALTDLAEASGATKLDLAEAVVLSVILMVIVSPT